MLEKLCSKCKLIKPISKFGKDVYKINGLTSRCKYCISLNGKTYREMNKIKISKYNANLYIKNKEKILIRNKIYYNNNQEKVNIRCKKYQRSEKGAIILSNSRQLRRFKIKEASNNTIPQYIHLPLNNELQHILNLQNYKCFYCRCNISHIKGNIHLDHIIPLSKDGKHTIDNIQWLCASCNMSKQNKIISYPLNLAIVPANLL